MQFQSSERKDDNNKVRYHGLALAAQGRSGIKSQSLAFQNSKWSAINPKSRELESLESVVPGMTTVYVGRIPQEVSDSNIRRLLNECGNIMRWNRSVDPITRKLSSFGLCEFDSPVGVINAVNVLNGIKILGSQLLVKYQHGIDKEMAKWQNNRINDMLKQRGGDCTIETVLNELSVSDSKMRVSINRLLAAMHYNYDGVEQENKAECKQGSANKTDEINTGKYNKSNEQNIPEYKLPAGFKKHPKEKYREGIHEEILRKFDSRMKELDDEIHNLIRVFPGSMDISNDFTTDYLIEILEESYFKSLKINKYKNEMMKSVSNLIDLDNKNNSSEYDSEEECYNRDISNNDILKTNMSEDIIDNKINDLTSNKDAESTNCIENMKDSKKKVCVKDVNVSENKIMNKDGKVKIKLDISGTSELGCKINNENSIVFDSKVSHIFLSGIDSEKLLFDAKTRGDKAASPLKNINYNKNSVADYNDASNEYEHNVSRNTDLNETETNIDTSLGSNILISDHWNIVFESNIDINDYKNYIVEEMKKIIGGSDVEALNTITDFILEMLSPTSRYNIQENINMLKNILDDETEQFLKNLYIKIIEG
ncbi:hypothetical protein FG379_000077 [Cryptosporidium bovis]|uniref:uncharacterized protein n=1 Tax=Cryptosporidium bovis TaxID=310047 RepID=UPI00351A0C94|nr:hypothetical protein FG379_000077 [Cryptosporidium bovis]